MEGLINPTLKKDFKIKKINWIRRCALDSCMISLTLENQQKKEDKYILVLKLKLKLK